MNNNLNLNNSAAVNVDFLDDSNSKLKGEITREYKSFVHETHLNSPHPNQKDVFRYLMENLSAGGAEQNVTNLRLVDFTASPHQVNKMALEFTLTKDAVGNGYHARLGFNLHPLVNRKYTLIIEYFPPELGNVSLIAGGDMVIDRQSTVWVEQTDTIAGYITKPHPIQQTNPQAQSHRRDKRRYSQFERRKANLLQRPRLRLKSH